MVLERDVDDEPGAEGQRGREIDNRSAIGQEGPRHAGAAGGPAGDHQAEDEEGHEPAEQASAFAGRCAPDEAAGIVEAMRGREIEPGPEGKHEADERQQHECRE